MNEYMIQAQKIISEWNAKSGAEKYAFCKNCVLRSIKNGRKLMPGDEIADAVQDTFIKVEERLADVDKLAANIKRRASKGMADSLAALICRAANSTMQHNIDQAKRDSVIIDNMTTTVDGEAFDLLDSVAATADTETSATIRATLTDFYNSLNSKNKIIFDGMMEGKTEREIAPTVEISNIAVHNRMVKIRAALAEML